MAATARPGPTTEAEFGRKREAAIAEVVAASPSKRARKIDNAPPGLARVALEAGEESAQNPTAASATVVSKVAKRAAPMKEQHLRGAAAAAKGRAKREQKVVQSQTQPRQGRDKQLAPVLRPGIMLVRWYDEDAWRKAQRLRFQVTSDPVDFVAKVAQVPQSKGKGHVVLAPPADTDFSVSGAIAAAFLGCFYATPKDFLSPSPSGITYKEKCKSSKQHFHVAVSASLATELPTLPQLLRGIAQAAGSCLHFYLSEKKLRKFLKHITKQKGDVFRGRVLLTTCVLAKRGEAENQDKKVRALYITPRDFLLRHEGSVGGVCPGCSQDDS